jgi:exodeoxyribonuclease VII large subunit
VDTSISDFVADMRAPTPSAAAELVSPDRFEWLGRFEQLERSLIRTMQNRISQHNFHLVQLVKRLRHPKDKLHEHMQRLDMADMRLKSAMTQRLQTNKNRLQHCQQALGGFKPDKQLALMQQNNAQLQKRLTKAIQASLTQLQQKLARQVEVLNAVSPLSTLSRGYAINTTENGEVIHNTRQVKVGDTIHAQLHQGKLSCTVSELHDK